VKLPLPLCMMIHTDVPDTVLQNYHVDGDGHPVPLPNTGSPLIAPNQMSHAKVCLAQIGVVKERL
jgi:hypothetical protein